MKRLQAAGVNGDNKTVSKIVELKMAAPTWESTMADYRCQPQQDSLACYDSTAGACHANNYRGDHPPTQEWKVEATPDVNNTSTLHGS